ncbi:MAG: leucyl aminopeptidase family protein [Candidatus Melainabacteria bacterium]|nr:leucyl aminopeptidase family protein [Candidatus Melainabacteria bacterium]
MKKLLVKIAAKEKPVKEISKDKPFLIYPDKALIEIYLPNLKTISDSELRKAISELPWKDLEYSELDLDISNLNTIQQEIVYEMIFLKSYFFDKYKTKNRKIKLKTIHGSKAQKLNFNLRDKLIDSVLFCRDIVSANASEINPGSLEALAVEITTKCPQIKLKTVSATEAKKLGMECLLAVGKESLINSGKEFHPRLLVLEFDPEMGNAEIEVCGQSYLGTARKRTSSRLRRTNDRSVLQSHLALVGKGITFDTGGLCLKPNQYMLDMKSDMAGAATVLSVFHLISKLSVAERKKIKRKITGVMALAENAFGGASYKPGDVLRALNGKTVQVVDTDAEGRLVLADALSYLSKLKNKPTHIIDLATLTGSIVATLGEVAAGAMTNDEEFLNKVQAAFAEEGEKLWHMPMLEEYKKKTDSEIADLAHCSSRPDALIAAQFLSNFIPKDSKWVHLDIAGVGFIEHDGLFAYKGATGFGVRGLYRLLVSS